MLLAFTYSPPDVGLSSNLATVRFVRPTALDGTLRQLDDQVGTAINLLPPLLALIPL